MSVKTVTRITCDHDGCLEARDGLVAVAALRRLLYLEGWEIGAGADRCPKHKRRFRSVRPARSDSDVGQVDG